MRLESHSGEDAAQLGPEKLPRDSQMHDLSVGVSPVWRCTFFSFSLTSHFCFCYCFHVVTKINTTWCEGSVLTVY